MARVTVEDCIVQVPNRFELVMYAAQRARDVSGGSQILIDRDRDKNPVVALREIAEETIQLDQLKDSVVRGMQKHVEMDEPEEAPELETTLFGVADPTLSVISDEEIDEEAVDEELDEDLLSVAGEDEIGLSDEPAVEDEVAEDEIAEDEIAEDEVADEEEP